MYQTGAARVARTPMGYTLHALGQPARARARARHVELAHIHRRAPRPIDVFNTCPCIYYYDTHVYGYFGVLSDHN